MCWECESYQLKPRCTLGFSVKRRPIRLPRVPYQKCKQMKKIVSKYKILNLIYTYHDKNATEGRLSAKPNQKFNLSQFVNFGDLVKIMSRQSRPKTIIYIVQCAVHCGFGGASCQRWERLMNDGLFALPVSTDCHCIQ